MCVAKKSNDNEYEEMNTHLRNQYRGLLECVLVRHVLKLQEWVGEEVGECDPLLRTPDQAPS